MANRNINGDVNVEFTEATSRQGLDSGESVKTLFGKIRKWLSDLKAVAFSGSYNDLTNKPTIPPAVAVKGNAETAYRTGNVNLTPANLGLDPLGYYGIGGRTTNTTTNPWVLVAETVASNSNNAGITLLFDYTFTPANSAKSTGTGILSVNVRTDANGAITANRSYAKWLTRTNELNNDDVVITYNNSTKSLQIWGKSDYPYKVMRVRPLSGSDRFNLFDISKWTFTTSLNTNMYESYPTGDGITVLTPTCDIQEQINKALLRDNNKDIITTDDDTRNITLEGSGKVELHGYNNTDNSATILLEETKNGNNIIINRQGVQLNGTNTRLGGPVYPYLARDSNSIAIETETHTFWMANDTTFDPVCAWSSHDGSQYIYMYASGDIEIYTSNSSGTAYKTINIQPDIIKIDGITMPIANNSGFHNSIFRGKYLGNSYTLAQKAQVQAGTFDNLFVGDYWTINGVTWRIAHFDYYLNTGTPKCTTHHIVVVPDTCLVKSYMNPTATTAGGYVGSYMYTTTLLQDGTEASNSVFGKIKAAFGESNLLSTQQRFVNVVNDSGNPSSMVYVNTRCFLMNQAMLYGHYAFGAPSPYNNGYNVGFSKSQLSLFRLDPSYITTDDTYWLSDILNDKRFARIMDDGGAFQANANSDLMVRPVFLLC